MVRNISKRHTKTVKIQLTHKSGTSIIVIQLRIKIKQLKSHLGCSKREQ